MALYMTFEKDTLQRECIASGEDRGKLEKELASMDFGEYTLVKVLTDLEVREPLKTPKAVVSVSRTYNPRKGNATGS